MNEQATLENATGYSGGCGARGKLLLSLLAAASVGSALAADPPAVVSRVSITVSADTENHSYAISFAPAVVSASDDEDDLFTSSDAELESPPFISKDVQALRESGFKRKNRWANR